MDTFSNPLPSAYLTWTRFIIPLETGGIQGLAVTRTQYEYLNAAYALLIAGVCGFAWQIVIYFALRYCPTEERLETKDREKNGSSYVEGGDLSIAQKQNLNRYVALVAIWNAPDPWTAIAQLVIHASNMCFKSKDLSTSFYDIAIIAIALLLGAITIAAGIIVPSRFLEQGAVAPANPASVFFSSVTKKDMIPYMRSEQTRGAAIQRATGIVEFARHELQKIVNVYPKEVMDWTGPDGERVERIAYDYTVTGLDFGLQHKDAVHFSVKVKGACTLEYGWFNTTRSTNVTDSYDAFSIPVGVSRIGLRRAPSGIVLLNTSFVDQPISNKSYVIIPETVGRISYIQGTDPWYTTTALRDKYGFFEVENRRPVLSCWQQDTWTYKEHAAKTTDDLGFLA